MNTFLIFVFVFGIFGWCIWQLLRFTRDTIGENSPLKVERVYFVSTLKYFTTIESLVIFSFVFEAGMCFRLLFVMEVHGSQHLAWLAYWFIFIIFAMLLGVAMVYMLLLINHLKYTEDITMITCPDTHEIEIHIQGKTLRLGEGDIAGIRVVYTNSKLNFGYLTYYLTNGDFFILSDRMPGFWVIQEYFKKVTVTHEIKRFPYIR